jgi:uncharacterized membrane protein
MRSKTIILICAGLVNAFLIYRYFSTLVTEGNQSANGFGAVFLIIFLGLFNASLFVIFFVKKTPLVRAGLLIAVFPIICAFLFSLFNGGSMFDEGSGGGGYLWLLMISVPIGLLLIVIGLIVSLFKRFKS